MRVFIEYIRNANGVCTVVDSHPLVTDESVISSFISKFGQSLHHTYRFYDRHCTTIPAGVDASMVDQILDVCALASHGTFERCDADLVVQYESFAAHG